MFGQLRDLLSYVMNYGQNSGNIELAFKLTIGLMILYGAVYFFMKRKSRSQGHVAQATDTATPRKNKSQHQSQSSQTIDDIVDRKLIRNLKRQSMLDDELKGLKTLHGYDTEKAFDSIYYFLKHASDIAEDLKRNEAKYNKGVATSTKYYGDVSMDNYNVEIVTDMGIFYMSLNELSSVSSVDDLRGHIDNGLFLSERAFDIIPATV